MTPEDNRGFGGLSWSPDGTRLVIECPPEATSDGNGQICVLNIDGTGLWRLLPSNLLGFSPAWSPDGRWIAFISQSPEGLREAINIVSPNGSQMRTVVNDADFPSPPVWSPDGTKFAYTPGNGGTKIVLADVYGSDSCDFDTGDRSPSNPSWSPDGNSLLFLTSSLGKAFSGLSVINADGTGLRDIVLDDDIAWAIWSSDGQAMAVVRSSPEPSLATPGIVAQRITLEVLRLDGTASRTLSEETVASEVDALIDGPSSWQPVATAPGR
ncbi:MAG TPA: hypothetical protein VHV31_03715 [Nitrolancea sp.]|nr:hypothetical protein [Nitrolancea sp.]